MESSFSYSKRGFKSSQLTSGQVLRFWELDMSPPTSSPLPRPLLLRSLLSALCLFPIPFTLSIFTVFPPSLLLTPSPAIPPQPHPLLLSLSLSLGFPVFAPRPPSPELELVSPGDKTGACPALPRPRSLVESAGWGSRQGGASRPPALAKAHPWWRSRLVRPNPGLVTGTDACRAWKELEPRATSSLMTCPVLSALGEAGQQGSG